VRRLASDFGTPLYLLDATRVVASLERLRAAIATEYASVEITYSVKSNYLTHILRTVLAAGFRLEIVSRRELDLARLVGAQSRQILFNGPVKSPADLRDCYREGIDLNVDSLEELHLASTISTIDKPFRLGLRLATTLRNGSVSRFGLDLDDGETLEAIRAVRDAGHIHIVGLHLHHSSRRDAASYCDRLDQMLDAAERLAIAPEYLDLGGGIGSIPPPEIAAKLTYAIDSHQSLGATIGRHACARLGSHGPRILLEPGIGVLADAMNYVVTLVAVKARANGAAVAVADGSAMDVNPLRSAIHPPCFLLTDSARPVTNAPVPLYGGTCMEIDQLGTFDVGHLPQAGDLAVLTNVGAYSVSLAPDFIVPRAAVYSLDAHQLLRPRQEAPFTGAGA
jgi:diaminopimelate decarboxylase